MLTRMKKRVLVALAFAAITVCFTACKPKVGANCSVDGKVQCQDKATAFVCHSKKWEVMACRGPKGCTGAGASTECDQTVAKVTDVCNNASDYTCSDDKKQSLHCKNDKWELDEPCGGPKGCTQSSHTVDCDTTFSKEGDKCTREDNHACTPDKKGHVVCHGGKFVLTEYCRGQNSCRVVGDKINCDDSLASVGDPCDTEDNYACSVDAKTILKCRSKKFILDETCRKGLSCKVSASTVGCK